MHNHSPTNLQKLLMVETEPLTGFQTLLGVFVYFLLLPRFYNKLYTDMKTKKENNQAAQAATGDKGQEANVSQPKRYSKLGEWLHDPDRKPVLKIIDMKAVLK
ncbi:hypothetical protein Barb4_03492 [Bacteroidales bacterium Barb4]|nr:hypothetical protein Barb4_03492 [Bacteroidales bacterium Barb4]